MSKSTRVAPRALRMHGVQIAACALAGPDRGAA